MQQKQTLSTGKAKFGTDDCNVVKLDPDTYAECPCIGPNSCPYALPFGYAFLCQNPRYNDFIRKDKTAYHQPS